MVSTTYIYKNDTPYLITVSSYDSMFPEKGGKILFSLSPNEEYAWVIESMGGAGMFMPFADMPNLYEIEIYGGGRTIIQKSRTTSADNLFFQSSYTQQGKKNKYRSTWEYVFKEELFAGIEPIYKATYTYHNDTWLKITGSVSWNDAHNSKQFSRYIEIEPQEAFQLDYSSKEGLPAPFVEDGADIESITVELSNGLKTVESAYSDDGLFDLNNYTLTDSKDEFNAAYSYSFTDAYFRGQPPL